MGHGILYCTSCQTQLRDPDFDKGAAYRLEGQAYCEKCARELIATLPEDRINEILRAFESTHDEPPNRPPDRPPERPSENRSNRTTRIMKALAANPASRILTSTSRRMATVPSEGGNPAALIVGIGAAVLLLVALAIVGVSGDAPSTKPVAAKPPPAVDLPETMPAAPDRPARLIAAARDFGRKNPDDLLTQISLFEQVLMEPGGSRYTEDVNSVLRELRRKLAEQRTSALLPVQREVRTGIAHQNFKAAAAAIAAARTRRGDPEWDRSIEPLSQELDREIARAFAPLRDKAVDARQKGLVDEVRRIQDRVAGWGRPDLSRDLDTALAVSAPTPAPAPPPPPPPSPPTPAAMESARREAAANELFQSAENLHRSPATRAEALVKFSTLLSDLGGTQLVASKRALIAERLETAKDQLFLAADLRPTGGYRFGAWKKAGAAWTADADVPPAARAQNYLELSFAALPGTDYAAWAYAGACCAEAFVFHIQGSELSFVDPKTREKALAEIGSGQFVTLKPATSLLKAHAAHGARRDPVQWQWVPLGLTLPRYATAGEKRLRFFGETQGFSVAWVAVSATRRAHPSDTEMKDLEKQRPDSAPEAAEARLRTGLVAHWRMDEGTGLTVADATGRHPGTLRNGVSWTTGVIGKALKFDGDRGHLDCGANEALNLRKAITLAAWVRCTVDPVQYDGVAMKSNKDWANGYGMWFETPSMITFYVTHCSQANVSATISSRDWNHVAGTYDGKRLRIYVNGKEGAGRDYTGEITPSSDVLVIGKGANPENPVVHTLNGEIDDVRLYDRALDESEIRALSAVRR